MSRKPKTNVTKVSGGPGAGVSNGQSSEGNGSEASVQAELISGWLDGESGGMDLLTWLGQDEEITSSEEVAELREIVANYERQLQDVKSKLDKEIKAHQDDQNNVATATVGLSERMEDLVEERDRLRQNVEGLSDEVRNYKAAIERSLKDLPEDNIALIIKEIELDGMESRLQRMKETTAASDLSGITSELEERYQAELREKEGQWRQRENDLRNKMTALEKDMARAKIDLKLKEDELRALKTDGKSIDKNMIAKINSSQAMEREFLTLKQESDFLREKLKEREDELDRIRESITYKEDELIRREEDIMYREKLYTAERKKFDEMKRDTEGLEEAELKKKLEILKSELSVKEDEMRAKERYLLAKQDELRLREQGLIEDDIVQKEKERALELQEKKVKTGLPRLDDLLLGGMPIGSNIMIHGPPFIGKEVMANTFVAEGLKKGVPALFVLTDKTAKDIRAEMMYILSGYEEYERLGLVKYIDTYSRAMGDDTQDEFTTYIDEPNDHEKMGEMVEEITKAFKKKHEYYRMIFRSVSTLIAYSDPNLAFRFLSPLCGRRKKDLAVSFFIVEKGMHGEQEIQMLGSIMDGMIDFKVDQLKTFFAVKGISDTQSRAYIRYTATKSNLSIGSFALDHIR